MAEVGTLKVKAASWKDYFFPKSTISREAERGTPVNFPKPAVGMLPNDRPRLFRDSDPQAAETAERRAHGGVDHHQCRGMGPDPDQPRTVLTPPAGGSPMPDIPNWCWHEYGNRVGFWRLLQVYDEFKIPGVMNINGVAVEAFPDIVKACVERNWEFVGHGYTQRNMQKSRTSAPTSANVSMFWKKPPANRPRAGSAGADRNLGDPGYPFRGRLRLCRRLGARRPAGLD